MISNEKLYLALGENIRRHRKERKPRGLTQEELAKKTNSTRSTIANIETGSQSVLLHTIYEIAEALDVQIKDILPSMSSVQSEENSIKLGNHVIVSNSTEKIEKLELTSSVLQKLFKKDE